MEMKSIFKNDQYKKSRGGYSRLLEIRCERDNHFFFRYQKDGPGSLKRMYIDRIINPKNLDLKNGLICPEDGELLAIPIIYKKENRPALRIFVGAIKKKIVKLTK